MSPEEPPVGDAFETVRTPKPFEAPAIENVTLPVALDTLIALAVPMAVLTIEALAAAVIRP